jgi:hypothetical protein
MICIICRKIFDANETLQLTIVPLCREHQKEYIEGCERQINKDQDKDDIYLQRRSYEMEHCEKQWFPKIRRKGFNTEDFSRDLLELEDKDKWITIGNLLRSIQNQSD